MNEQNGQVDIERLKKLDADYWHTRPGAEVKREIDDLLAHLERLEGDQRRLDWLADPANPIGNVQLPKECVARNVQSLRAAIDDAMNQQQKEGHPHG